MFRTIIIVFFSLLFIAFWCGIFLRYATENLIWGNRLIGASILLGFFIWMPLFLFYRSKGRNVKDYMLTEENIKKMRDKGID